jgi:hypothetical protein
MADRPGPEPVLPIVWAHRPTVNFEAGSVSVLMMFVVVVLVRMRLGLVRMFMSVRLVRIFRFLARRVSVLMMRIVMGMGMLMLDLLVSMRVSVFGPTKKI